LEDLSQWSIEFYLFKNLCHDFWVGVGMAALFQMKNCQVFDVESHISENSRTLIGNLGGVFSLELQLSALEQQQNNNSKTIRNNDTEIMFQNQCRRSRSQKHFLILAGFLFASS